MIYSCKSVFLTTKSKFWIMKNKAKELDVDFISGQGPSFKGSNIPSTGGSILRQ